MVSFDSLVKPIRLLFFYFRPLDSERMVNINHSGSYDISSHSTSLDWPRNRSLNRSPAKSHSTWHDRCYSRVNIKLQTLQSSYGSLDVSIQAGILALPITATDGVCRMSTKHYGASATVFAAACSLHSLICTNTDKYMDRLKDYLRDHMAANNFKLFEIELTSVDCHSGRPGTIPVVKIYAIKPDDSKYLVADCWNEPTGFASFTHFYWEG